MYVGLTNEGINIVMDPYLHTLIALGFIVGSFSLGKFLAVRESFTATEIDDIVDALLNKLEADGYLYTTTDKDGDKELVPVSTVVAKALSDIR